MSTATAAATRKPKLRMNSSIIPATRHPARLVAAALVLVLSALTAIALYNQIGDRTQVLVFARDVEQGNTITANDLRVVDVAADDGVATVSASQHASIVGQVATTRVASGSLVTKSFVAEGAGLQRSQARVGAALKTGQFPSNLRAGDPVMLVVAPTPESPVTEPVRGTVSSVEAGDATSGTTSASFVVPELSASAVGIAGANGGLVVVELPR